MRKLGLREEWSLARGHTVRDRARIRIWAYPDPEPGIFPLY